MHSTGPPIAIHPPPQESISKLRSSQNVCRCCLRLPSNFPALTPKPTFAEFGPLGIIHAYPEGATEPMKTSNDSGISPCTCA